MSNWIAKPLDALSIEEKRLILGRGPVPLSQTWAWQRAVQSIGGRCYLILHVTRLVGGFVHSFDDQHFECINGPILSWDHPECIAGELATFAQAVSRLSRSFRSMTLAPRWDVSDLSSRLSNLPIQPTEVNYASTIWVPVESTSAEQIGRAHPRMRRTLARGARAGLAGECLVGNDSQIERFVAEIREVGKLKNFFVPPLAWFKTLMKDDLGAMGLDEKITFQLIQVSSEEAYTQLLIVFTPQFSHYLFGYDDRPSGTRQSTAAAAQFQALDLSRARGISYYDLNGYTDPSDLSHPYAGVSQFKSQWGGAEVRWAAPKFVIS